LAATTVSPLLAQIDDAVELVTTLQPPEGSLAQGFGTSIAMDHGVVVLGAEWDSGRGSVYVFEQDADDPEQWRFASKLVPPSETFQSFFGDCVDVDNDLIVVNAPGGHGAVIYERNDRGDWSQVTYLRSSGNQLYGGCVRIEDDIALVGGEQSEDDGSSFQPAVFVFRRDAETPDTWRLVHTIKSPLPDEDGRFGFVFDLSDGQVVIPEWSGRTAYLFGRNAGGLDQWGLLATLRMPSDVSTDETFNGAVAIGDGVVAIGATFGRNSDFQPIGAVHVFEQVAFDPGFWRYAERLQPPSEGFSHYNHQIGADVAISGRLLLAGTLRYGAHLFAKGALPGARWRYVTTIKEPEQLPGQAFGNAVAVSGATAIVGGDDIHPGGSGSLDRGLEPETAHIFQIVSVCSSDINRDNAVDTSDLGLFIRDFGSDAEQSDINGDGVVDAGDLGLLLLEFGATGCDTSR